MTELRKKVNVHGQNNETVGAGDGQWFVINTNPKSEQLVARLLRREAYSVFFPKLENRKKNKTEPLFPGYLFVRLDVADPGWAKIRYFHGVRKILSLGDRPIPVPEILVSTLMRAKDTYFTSKLSLKRGDRVRFTRGPFEGLVGIFTGKMSGKQRVKVLLESVQRNFTIEVSSVELGRAV